MVALIRKDENNQKYRLPFEENNVGFLDALELMADFLFKRVEQGYLVSPSEKNSGYFVHFPGAKHTFVGLEYDN